MSITFRNIARIACVLSLLACADTDGPVAPASDSTAVALESLGASSMEPTPEELAELPPEFQQRPTIISMKTEVGFVKGDGAWAQGSMDYYGTDAEQEVTLTIYLGDTKVAEKTAKGVASHFFPTRRSLHTMVALPLSAACGHRADGHTQH